MAKKSSSVNQFKKYFIVFGFLLISIIAFLRYGIVGNSIDNILQYLIGDFYKIIISVILVYLFLTVFLKKITDIKYLISLILLVVILFLVSALLKVDNLVGLEIIEKHLSFNILNLFSTNKYSFQGGLIGNFLLSLTTMLFEKEGSILIVVALIALLVIILIPIHLLIDTGSEVTQNAKQKIYEIKQGIAKNRQKQTELVKIKTAKISEESKNEEKIIEKKLDIETIEKTNNIKKPKYFSYNNYKLPSIELLNPLRSSSAMKINRKSADIKGEKIIDLLESFNIPCKLNDYFVGPSVTKFEIKPEKGVKISQIQGLYNNIKMEVAANALRIEAPIPGKDVVGIEIPNAETIPVQMLEMAKSLWQKNSAHISVILGKDVSGNNVFCDLDKMPHLLVAGATGSGKSVCMNSIISSILLFKRPDEVKLMLIDPKRVEFIPYVDVPHLFWPVITDANKASLALQRIVAIMEERYEKLAQAGVRNIESYNNYITNHNEKCSKEERMQHLPFIVVIIDELADLMIVAGKEVEISIQQITQKARAAGIHLIVATQRPSTDVITGVIKANIPSRIAFAVSSQIDSRTILDTKGAEDLLGKGDMLYSPMGSNSPTRVQGVFIEDNEIQKITDYVKKIAQPEYEDSYYQLENLGNNLETSNSDISKDPLYNQVVEYVKEIQKCSTSLLQRRFGIGYNRAARMVDCLEENGIVGPAQGSKPREVYLK